jgi:hypothetical protein
MKVFIGWSGDVSKAVATALHDWLGRVIQAVKPWMSDEDLDKGARWSTTIARELQDARVGVVCLTRDNLTNPWIHFEAGALAKVVEESFVWTYLFHVKNTDVVGPLSQFQHTTEKKEDTKKLVETINRALIES